MTRATIRARAEAATEGPWTVGRGKRTVHNWLDVPTGIVTEEDRTLAIHARQDIPALLAVADSAAGVLATTTVEMSDGRYVCRECDIDVTHWDAVLIHDPDCEAGRLRDALAALEALP